MPELYSRTDNAGWLTPSIADILTQGTPPPGGDGSIREHMLIIQKELANLETPVKIVNVRSMPSYTLYVARPETIGRLGSRRAVTPSEIRRSLARIAEQHPDWAIGFIPKLENDDNTLGILLRTAAHRPLSLRRLLVRGSFRSAPASHTFTLGITLEQNLIVRDLHTTRHLLVIGKDNAKVHFLRSFLLTLLVLNTPSELRVIMAGRGVEHLKALIASPHSLGRTVNQAEALHKILNGLRAEAERRRRVFEDHQVADIEAFNLAAKDRQKSTLPRIVVVIDSLADAEWETDQYDIVSQIQSLLDIQADIGLHFVLAMPEMNDFRTLRQRIHTHVILRSVAKALIDQIPDFHPSLLRFIDAVIADYDEGRILMTPVELCSTSNNELINAVTYWQQNRLQRRQEHNADLPVSGHTGVTDLLSLPGKLEEEEALTPTPAAEPPFSAALPSAPYPAPNHTQTSTSTALPLAPNAAALAAHLGWLSTGVLEDVFAIDSEQAAQLLEQLKRQGILEDSPYPTPRFLRR
jgi:hypothetical protein